MPVVVRRLCYSIFIEDRECVGPLGNTRIWLRSPRETTERKTPWLWWRDYSRRTFRYLPPPPPVVMRHLRYSTFIGDCEKCERSLWKFVNLIALASRPPRETPGLSCDYDHAITNGGFSDIQRHPPLCLVFLRYSMKRVRRPLRKFAYFIARVRCCRNIICRYRRLTPRYSA